MNRLVTQRTRIITALIGLMALSSCSNVKQSRAEANIPVSWGTGFKMPSLLANPNAIVPTKENLPRLLEAPWYASISVTDDTSGETTLSNCKTFFEKSTPNTHTLRANETNAFVEFKAMCEAAKILVNASPSVQSTLPNDILNSGVPDAWPKEFALQISAEESKRNALNTDLKTWSDITPITRFERISDSKAIYYHTGGYQELEIVGRGDMNNDGNEDVLLAIYDYVDGGSYFNVRLVGLTHTQENHWLRINTQ